ncbi:LuxR C-terminal-related transcriptional regulator [Inconstantimicrobium mannanitabidum]|uniref:Helix-turn-helix transcriptional regulator n=1 Tax=Inconstantimicrobium mannanitabidum TaxID=1604901 RepID=A0ACB5RD10_9CLOT|nr:LuxR C-terminal-related transcriptional regulator [Clostridium sp. TW13]GKX67154.1 helix-turn-helix transcriptional regulator [Clostridium sp. TW13]
MKNIVYTRLIRPKNKKNNIVRNLLNNKIKEIVNSRVTIVKGGPAAGKTTLISAYLQEKTNYSWISLDEESDDLTYFWVYVVHALKSKLKNSELYIDMLKPLVNREDIFNIIGYIINELMNEEELIFVLDDFHYIKDKFLCSTIEYFIKNSSESIHFILVSREEIPIYLSDIMMNGELINIEADEFKLSLDEASEFIRVSLKKNIEDNIIQQIYEKTEGWIGGIQLILTISKELDRIISIPKENKFFIDYISKEIISWLSSEEIELLVKTSPLNYVDQNICTLLVGDNGAKLIQGLIEKNMLIITIDEENKIYRYHNVLREFLLKLFNEISGVTQNEIIKRLIDYLIQKEDYDEALRLAIEWRLYDIALKLIEKYAHLISSTKILGKIPLEYYRKSIDLAFIAAFNYYFNFDYEHGAEIISTIADKLEDGNWRCMKIYKMITEEDIIDLGEDDINFEMIGNMNPLTKVVYCIIAACGYRFIGDYRKSLEIVEYADKVNKQLNNRYIDIFCIYNKTANLEDMGRLKESEQGYIKLKSITHNKEYNMYFSIFGEIGLPGIYIKKMMLNEAENLLIMAEKNSEQFRDKSVFITLNRGIKYNLAEVKFLQGNFKEAENMLSVLVEENKDNVTYLSMVALKIRLLSVEDRIEPEEYTYFIQQYKQEYKANFDLAEMTKIAYVISLFKLEKYEECEALIDEIIFICRKNLIGYSLIYALLWKIIIMQNINKNQDREYINYLKEAVFYSRDDDIVLPYYLHRKYLKDILLKYEKDLSKDEGNEEFLRKVLDLISEQKKMDVLSGREIEVLTEISNGLSNKEIGEKLYISVSTVKTHIINIYSKLGVKNRLEAVNKAKLDQIIS